MREGTEGRTGDRVPGAGGTSGSGVGVYEREDRV